MIKLLFSSHKPWKILCFIFFIIFIFRIPSLLIDFYDVDELIYSICANEILEGGKPYIDYIEQRPPVIHYFYALIFWLFGNNNLHALHFITIIIISLTSFYLYKTTFLLVENYPSSYFTALAYGIFITAFDESFMASNAEVLFNFPISIACYTFVKYYFCNLKKYTLLIVSSFFITLAFLIKQQGGVFLGVVVCYLFLLQPIIQKKKFSFKYSFSLSFHLSLWFIIFIALSYGAMYWGGFLNEAIYWNWIFPLTYIKSSQSSITDILMKYFNRQGTLLAVQSLLWTFFIAFIWRLFFLKKKIIRQEKKKSFFLLLFFIFSYLPIFLGGIRLYYHYFVQYLLPLVLISGFQFFRWKESIQKKKNIVLLNTVLISIILIFSVWHYHDIYKKYYTENPLSKRNLNYLAERSEYKDVTRWIRENSTEKDKIFVWGDCPQIYFFSNRRVGGPFIVFDYLTLDNARLITESKNLSQYKISHTNKKIKKLLNLLLENIKKKKPKYIIDISPSNFNGYGRYPIKNYKVIYNYLLAHYQLKKEMISNMKIWIIK